MELDKTTQGSEGLEIFQPVGNKDLKTYHPELNEYEEFKKIHYKDLLFVWRYVISYSGIDDDKQRVEMAIDSAYLKDEISTQKRNRFLSLDFPSDVENAIKRMQSFDPSIRLMARYITETTFMSYQKILNIVSGKDIKHAFTGEDGTVDWSKISQFVNATVKMNESLPSLINKMEEGYGFGKKKNKLNFIANDGTIEDWHNIKSNKQ